MDEEVLEKIVNIEERLDALEKIAKTIRSPVTGVQTTSPRRKDFLALSHSLQKTLRAIQELGEAMSKDVAKKTGRSRSVETIYLNQLARLGYLNKERRGRRIYFKILRYY